MKKSFRDLQIGDYVCYGRIEPPVIKAVQIKGKVEHYLFTDFYFENPYSKRVVANYDFDKYDEFSVENAKINDTASVHDMYDGIFLNYEQAFKFVDKGMHEMYDKKKADLDKYVELMNEFKKEHYNEASNS